MTTPSDGTARSIKSTAGTFGPACGNHFGIKRAARHTKWCTVTTEEVFTPAHVEAWDHQHAGKPARVIAILPDGRQRVEIDDEFADYDSIDASCQDYAWLITHGRTYREAWHEYQQNKNLAELIGGVTRTYATAPRYGEVAKEIATQSNVIKAIWGSRCSTGNNIAASGNSGARRRLNSFDLGIAGQHRPWPRRESDRRPGARRDSHSGALDPPGSVRVLRLQGVTAQISWRPTRHAPVEHSDQQTLVNVGQDDLNKETDTIREDPRRRPVLIGSFDDCVVFAQSRL